MHFFVETSCSSFSAGNEFPFMMKDAGYKILGEPSGGGSCAIMMNTTDDGPALPDFQLAQPSDGYKREGCRFRRSRGR